MEQLNATSVYKDWDDGEDTIEGRKKRYEDCHWEMIWSLALRRAFKLISFIMKYPFKTKNNAICLKCRIFKSSTNYFKIKEKFLSNKNK